VKRARRNGVSVDSPTIRMKYAPQGPTMAQFHKVMAFVRIVIGPLGSSKTFGAIHDMLNRCHTQVPDRDGVRRSRWCVARNTFPDLQASTIPDFREVVDKLPFGTFTNGSPAWWKAEYKRKDGTTVKCEVMFRSFDGIQDVKKARGMQLSGVLVDELGEFNKANFDMLIGRVKRYPSKADVPKASFHVIAISNAVPRDHWLAKLALAPEPPHNWWIGVQPGAVYKELGKWVVNPQAENLNNLADNYYEDQIGGKKDSWIRQNLANEFVYHTDGRPIHPDYSEHLHSRPCVATPGIPLHLGMDWGRTPACIIGQQMPNGQWRILQEICLTNAGADKLGARVKQVLSSAYAGYTVLAASGDPSGESMTQANDDTPFLLFNINSGLSAMPTDSNDPTLRYAVLDDQLTQIIEGEPAIIIDPSCEMVNRGLSGEYCFKRIQAAGDERYKDEPDKGMTSHPVEALHYLLQGAGMGQALFDDEWTAANEGIESWAPDQSYFE
jgi:hypothetical protein